MSAQDDFNNNYGPYVLYYINNDQKISTLYNVDLSDVCTGIAWNDPLYTEVVLTGWLLGSSPSQPSNATLIAFDLATVLAWYNFYYVIPQNIIDEQYYKISTSDLANVRTSAAMLGMKVFDTTAQINKEWNGSLWVNNFVGSSSSSVTDSDIVVFDGTTGKLIKTSGVALSSLNPSACMIWSPDNVGVAFTAATVRLIPITGFTESVDLNADFTPTTTTGLITYTGSATKYFRVTIMYSLLNESPVSTQTFESYVSKNGGTTINGVRSVATFALTTVQYAPRILRDIVQLATDDTIQFGGVYSATATLNFDDVSVSVEQI